MTRVGSVAGDLRVISKEELRIQVQGKFLHVGGQRLWIKGVAYGTFAPDSSGRQFPSRARMASDFCQMATAGINTVRTYSAPTRELLDEAWAHGLRVMAGIEWPQHVAFLDDAQLTHDIRHKIRVRVTELADHPAILMFALGNEIPASVVRWHGPRAIERFLRALYEDGKTIAPESLFTYVNYPPTEYLELPFFDVCSFNVYLHDEADLRAYLARLQNIAGQQPLLLAEAGADSLRQGEEGQAALTLMALRATFSEGACGAVIFSWTDEWWRGGSHIEDWKFGLVDAERRPKLALPAVARVFTVPPVQTQAALAPKVSVVVCAYNEARTIGSCLRSLERLAYPNYEVIVVNDGSTDLTGEIARRYPNVRLIETANGGLSAARNVGARAATGEIVAYTDADVEVDPFWLTYLVQPFADPAIGAAGGPNVVPPDDPLLAQCVARAPGGPTHVLLDDRLAEHVPGCNIALRREALLAIGGFDVIFVKAGDDVDLCWRLQSHGWKIAFAPAALVWHHHRPSIKAYWRQQVGYGEGETWLMPRHPERFAGRRARWRGHVYSPLPYVRSFWGVRVNSGPSGSASFPAVYRTDTHAFTHLPHTASWQCGSMVLVAAGALASVAAPIWLALTLLAIGAAGLAITIGKCLVYARRSDIRGLAPLGPWSPLISACAYRLIIAYLHFVQPLARAYGRVRGLLHPAGLEARPETWRSAKLRIAALRGVPATLRLLAGRRATLKFWSESWIDAGPVLTAVAARLRMARVGRIAVDGGWWPDRDISLDLAHWGRLDVKLLIEEHHGGRCLLAFAARVRPTATGLLLLALWAGATALGLAGGPDRRSQLLLSSAAIGTGMLGAALFRTAAAFAAVRESLAALERERGIAALATNRKRTRVERAAVSFVDTARPAPVIARRRGVARAWPWMRRRFAPPQKSPRQRGATGLTGES